MLDWKTLKELLPPLEGETRYVYLLRACQEGLITQKEFITNCGQSDGVAVAGLVTSGILK